MFVDRIIDMIEAKFDSKIREIFQLCLSEHYNKEDLNDQHLVVHIIKDISTGLIQSPHMTAKVALKVLKVIEHADSSHTFDDLLK